MAMHTTLKGILVGALIAAGAQSPRAVDSLLFRFRGPFSIEWVSGFLESEDDQVRGWASEALAALGPDAVPALPAIARALKDEDERVRRFAVHAISNCGPEARGVLNELMPLLKDPDHSVRSRAALAAASVSPGSEDVAMTLVHMLKHDPNIWVREEVASALGTIQAAASEVKDVLESTARLRERAPAVTEHTEHTDFSEVMLRIAAAGALGRLRHDRRAVRWLMDVVEDRDTFFTVREAAVMALGGIGEESIEAIPVLCEAVRRWQADKEPYEVGIASVRALGDIGQGGESVVRVLLPLVSEPRLAGGGYNDQALWCLEAVGKIRPATKEAQVTLELALRYHDEGARLAAARSLVAMGYGSPEVVRVLIELLELETSPIPIFRGFSGKLRAVEMRRGAAEVLGKLGAEARPAVPALTKAKHDEFPSVRRAAEAALLHIGDAM